MSTRRLLTQQEREAVLAHVKPTGSFQPPRRRATFGIPPIAWEDRLGNLDDWRKHEGMGKAIAPTLSDHTKTQSVQNSILTRLRKLFPTESWSTYVDADAEKICLKYNGLKRTNGRKPGNVDDDTGLFSAAG